MVSCVQSIDKAKHIRAVGQRYGEGLPALGDRFRDFDEAIGVRRVKRVTALKMERKVQGLNLARKLQQSFESCNSVVETPITNDACRVAPKLWALERDISPLTADSTKQ